MSLTLTWQRRRRRAGMIDETISLAAGILFTFGLVAAMAELGNRAPQVAPATFDDLRVLTMPVETPPPPVDTRHEPEPAPTPLVGIEPGVADSPVKIAVVPPDLESLIPNSSAPPATIQPMQLYSDLKPKIDLAVASEHIFQTAEVDRIPKVAVRPDPVIPARVRQRADSLRVTVLFVVGTDGRATGLRVLRSSGNAEFDGIVMGAIEEDWLFTPAIKRGKKVRCMTQQTVTVKWSAASPFSV